MKSAIILPVLLLCSLAKAQTTASPATANAVPAQKSAKAQPAALDPTTEADIRKLLQLTGADKLADQMMSNTLNSIRPLLTSSLPAGEYREKLIELFLAKFQSKARGTQIVELAVPIYAKYFSDDEVKQLIAFYETPIGQKSVQTLPKLTAEMQVAGLDWGRNLGQESFQEVMAEHPELEKEAEQASQPQKKP